MFGLLAAAGTALAATHSTHAHRAPVQSAGKASAAHALHDAHAANTHATGAHAARTSEKAFTRRGQHAAPFERESRAAGKARKGTPSSKHSKGARDDGEHVAKAHSGHQRHGKGYREQPVDDPQPIHRAQNDRRPRNRQEQFAEGKPQRAAAKPAHEAPPIAPAPTAVLPQAARNGIPGNVARNMARRSGSAGPAPHGESSRADSRLNVSDFSSGVSHPDDDERPPRNTAPLADQPAGRDASSPQRARPVTLGRPAPGPTAILTAPGPAAPPTPQVVEGFGAEVDFRAPMPGQGAPDSAATRVSLAQQEQDLREAAEVASKPMFVPLVSREGKLLVPPPLKGSRDILVHQNQMADDAGLSRIQDDADLARMRRAHLLVDLEESASLRVNEGLPQNRRAARPWTVQFANDIAHAFYARFGEALQVNSAVRTVAYQLRLQRVNGNAAAADGEGASPHLTGQAIDLGKRGMSVAQIAWMRGYLMPLIEAGKIDVEEEFQQACFHISVYATYTHAPRRHAPARTEIAQVARPAHTHAAAPGADDDDMH